MRLVAKPVDAKSFADFGELVSCDRSDRPALTANLGSAERRDFIVDLANPRPAARLNLATFRCRPWPARPLELGMLEKHPASAQVFIPMSPGRFLVVVAKGAQHPLAESARAFLVSGQGVAYAPGIWHHPMIALDDPVDFSCVVWEDGTPLDCVTHDLATPLVIEGL